MSPLDWEGYGPADRAWEWPVPWLHLTSFGNSTDHTLTRQAQGCLASVLVGRQGNML